MIPKVTTGGGIRGAIEYDFSKRNGEPRGEYIGGTLFGSPREIAAQAGALRALRPDCKKPVFRVSLSIPPADGQLQSYQWEEIVESFKREMGIPVDAGWCAVRHSDRDHDHIHFTFLRILPDGKLWNQENSAKRAIAACQVIEQEFELSSHSREKTGKKRPSRAEIEISKREGITVNREHIQMVVDAALSSNNGKFSFESFRSDLATAGIKVDLYAPKGVFKGVSYTDHKGVRWPGSKIGRDYSMGLIERGLIVDAHDSKSSEATKPACKNMPLKDGELASMNEAPIPSTSIGLLSPAKAASQAHQNVLGTWNPIVAAVIGFNQVMLQLAADGFGKIAEMLARFVRSILRLLGINIADPAPSADSESQNAQHSRVTVQMPDRYQAPSAPAGDLAANTINQITQLAKKRDFGGLTSAVSASAEGFGLPTPSLTASGPGDTLAEVRHVRRVPLDIERPDYWLTDAIAHQRAFHALRGSASLDAQAQQAELRKRAAHALTQHARLQLARFERVKGSFPADQRMRRRAEIAAIEKFFLRQFENPLMSIPFDLSPARNAEQVERELAAAEVLALNASSGPTQADADCEQYAGEKDCQVDQVNQADSPKP